MTEIITENQAGVAFATPAIITKEHLREAIKTVLRDWANTVGLVEPKIKPLYAPVYNEQLSCYETQCIRPGQYSVMEFMEKMKAAREVANARGVFTGVAMTHGEKQMAWVGEIPALLMTMMQREFGGGFTDNPDVWNIFKDEFRMGSMNPNPKGGQKGSW